MDSSAPTDLLQSGTAPADLMQSGTIIEGVGDELVHAFGIFIVIAVPLVVAFVNHVNRNQVDSIHPDNEQRVYEARQRLGVDRETVNGDSPQQQQQQPQQQEQQQNGPASAPPLPRHRYSTDPTCPVCLNEMAYATETNCGHVFCGNCLITYWRHGNWLGSIRCPVCRQQVTLLLPCFREVDHTTDDAQAVTREINNYNRRFSGEPRPLMDYIHDLPTLLRHAIREFFTLSGLVWMFRIRIIVCFCAALLYFISPLDIIPEAVFGILGFLDDLLILLLLLIYVTIIYRGFIAARAGAV
ncbi:E3 ubiquitin-protein ligase RNF170-like isoform X2 [Acanthaster planci]|uniref:E3 ubiquitin-protein ligase RNF170 n=1 Tax=Acanthaster planci TaxID=133434 RepID=A0A8B7Z9R1_ACAPL|nr:E3 ubiquitin-protein ligase RNF170-like isoform X2 [Acanthaster planci]